MAKFNAYYEVNFDDFDLNYYRNAYESHRLVVNSTDPTNAGSDDRFTIWTTNNDKWAFAVHGSDFAYGGKKFATEGNVEAFSEWFYNTDPDVLAGEDYGRERIYLLKGINVDMQDIFDATKTNDRDDDFALLRSVLSGNDDIKMSDFDDRAYGYDGNDVMLGKGGADTLFGGRGDDKLRGGKQDDTLKGGADDDTLKGGAGNDVLRGNGGDDNLNGGGADDNMKGAAGDDKLNGSGGNDKVKGGGGNDILRGNSGVDDVWGGSGADVFVFQTGDEVDIIRDWAASDSVDLSGLASVNRWKDLSQNHMSQVGDDVVIDGGAGDVLTLVDTDMGTLTKDDFIFQ